MVHKRKIVVCLATSPDGFMARSDGSSDWLDRARPKSLSAFYRSIDTILWGTKTYEMARDFQKKGVARSGFDMRVKNYVFTQSVLQSAAPSGVEFVNEPIKAFALRLAFLDEGEIDEFMIHIVPEFICEGIPLIAARRRTVPLKLVSSTKFTNNVVKLQCAAAK